MAKQHGGKILTDQLAAHGISRVFSVPGESFLAALDGLYDLNIENIVCRQEGGGRDDGRGGCKAWRQARGVVRNTRARSHERVQPGCTLRCMMRHPWCALSGKRR